MSGPDQTPQMPDDRELEEFLAGRGPVREAYRAAAQQQPPTAVDDAILRMATQAAAEPTPVAIRKPRIRSRWQTSLAAAAVLVLSFGVFLQVHRDPVAERAVYAPAAAVVQSAPVEAQPKLAPMPASPAEHELKQAQARADQAQRQKSEMKKEMAAASGALKAEPPAPVQAAASDAAKSVTAETEADTRNFAMQDAQPAKPAAAPMAKALRSAPADRMAESAPAVAAAAPMASPSVTDAQLDHWLQTCAADSALMALSRDDSGVFQAPQLWHGLPVAGFADGALWFAPDVSREQILRKLEDLKPFQACLTPAKTAHGWQLPCGCTKHSHN